MSLTKVAQELRDAGNNNFNQVTAKVGTPPAAATDGTDYLVMVAALIKGDETLINPATEDKQDTANTSLATIAGLSKAEDAAHSSGDPGVMALSVRKDSAAATAGSDGDYQPLTTDANGRLHTNSVLAAGSSDIGKVGTTFGTTKTLTNANVSFNSSGENVVIAGTASQTIRVQRLQLTAAAAVTLTVKDAAGGTTLATIPLLAGGSWWLDFSGGEPWFVTATAGAFVISLSGAVQVSGFVQYTKS